MAWRRAEGHPRTPFCVYGKKFGRLESKATLLSHYTLLFGIGFPLIALTAILVHRIIFGRI